MTNSETGIFTFIHGLVFYEKITPSLVEQSKDRVPEHALSMFEVIPEEIEEEWYSPIVFCIQTQSNYIDFFYELLSVIYEFTYSLSNNLQTEKKLISSFELLKSIVFIVENTIIPPINFKFTMKIGEFHIKLPAERSGKFPHFEQSLIMLLEVLSIERIIEIWEIVLLNNQLIVYGSNDTLIYAVIHALHQIIFPLTWNMNIFIGMNYSKRNYLGCITPFIAGINKNRISADDLKKYAKNVYIVDLDSDSTCLVEKMLLCECQKKIIYNKLFLAKIFYFSGNQRIHTFRLNEYGRLVNDEKFKNLAKKMAGLQDQYKKDKAFGELIRRSFFKLLKNIRNFKEFIEIELKTNSFRFNKEEFLASIKVCKAANCTLVKFFQNLVETQSFQTFLDYYKKFDQSCFSRFRSMIEKKRLHPNRKQTYSVLISQKMHSLALIEILRRIRPINQSDSFEDESFRIFIEKIRNTLLGNSELYDSSQHPAYQKLLKKTSLTSTEHPDHFNKLYTRSNSSLTNLEISKFSTLLYGEKGFLRMAKIFFQGVKQENFSSHLEKYRISEFEKKAWQGTLLKSLYVLKYYKESEEKYMKLFKLLKKLSNSNPPSFPCYHAVKVIEKLSQSIHISKDDLLNAGGILSKLSKQYFLSLENPNAFYKLIVSNNINNSKSNLCYSTLSFIE